MVFLLAMAFADEPPTGDVEVIAPSGPNPQQTSAAVTVLKLGPELPPGEDLASVVERASGTSVRRMGGLGSFSALSLRGSGFRHVELFLDGLPLNPDGESVVDLSEFPPSAFERLELYRGNAPIAFGSAAMGGVVNLITPEERALPFRIGVDGGSFGTLLLNAAGGGSIASPLHLDGLLVADQFHTDGDFRYLDDRGTEFNTEDDETRVREHNGLDRTSVIGRLRAEGDAWTLSLLDAYARSDQELPGDAAALAHQATFAMDRNLLAARVDGRVGFWRMQPDLWWTHREQTFDDRLAEIGVGAQWTRDRFDTLGGQVLVTAVPQPWLVPQASLRLRQDRYAPYDRLTEQADGERLRLAGGLALGADLRWKSLSLSPVLQGEWLDDHLLGDVPFSESPVAPAGEDQQFAFTPRLGVLERPFPWLSLKGNVGSYLRPPDFTELFGDRGTIMGNTDLLPERGLAWDLGARLEFCGERAWLTAEAGWAENRSENLIVYVQNSQYTQQARNVGDAWVRSLEAALSIGFSPWIESESSLTFHQSRNLVADPTYANNELPGIPSLELSQSTTLGYKNLLRLGHTFSYTSATWYDAANYQRSAPRILHSFSLSVNPGPPWPSLKAEVLNLLDTRSLPVARDPLNPEDQATIQKPLTDFGGYPLPGRTFLVGLSWSAP